MWQKSGLQLSISFRLFLVLDNFIKFEITAFQFGCTRHLAVGAFLSDWEIMTHGFF